MDTKAKQTFIRQKAAQRRVEWSRHALGRLATEPSTVDDVEVALQRAEVIEDYPHLHRHLPDCLVLAHVMAIGAIHCVVAVNQSADSILMVTVYRPSEKEWTSDARTRK
jgi:hypothetical protein